MRKSATTTLLDFILLTRPFFLFGGLILNILGAVFALLDGAAFSLARFALGQALITSVQLMTHYTNEFYDLDTDRLNAHRTWFSGGSGVLARGGLSPQVARKASFVFLLLALVFTISAGVTIPWMGLIGSIALILAWFYSAPPLRLVSTGWGELTASLVVAGMVPLAGYVMQSGDLPGAHVLVNLLPLGLLHYALMIAFHIPDRDADQLTGKRTIAVRLALPAVIRLHNLTLFAAFCVILLLALNGSPGAQTAVVAAPLAIWQALGLSRTQGLTPKTQSYLGFTARALILFALTSILWLAGISRSFFQ